MKLTEMKLFYLFATVGTFQMLLAFVADTRWITIFNAAMAGASFISARDFFHLVRYRNRLQRISDEVLESLKREVNELEKNSISFDQVQRKLKEVRNKIEAASDDDK